MHNLLDTQTQLATLREMKQAGRIRYVGITTSFDNQYGEFEHVMKKETLDFVQVDFALDNRDAGDRLIPLAGDRGMAVMINLPFGRGRLFNAVRGKKITGLGETSSTVRRGRSSFLNTLSLILPSPAPCPAWRGPNTSSITSALPAGACPTPPCASAWSSLSMASDSGRAATKAKIYTTTKRHEEHEGRTFYLRFRYPPLSGLRVLRSQPIMLRVQPVKVRPWELAVYPCSYTQRSQG